MRAGAAAEPDDRARRWISPASMSGGWSSNSIDGSDVRCPPSFSSRTGPNSGLASDATWGHTSPSSASPCFSGGDLRRSLLDQVRCRDQHPGGPKPGRTDNRDRHRAEPARRIPRRAGQACPGWRLAQSPGPAPALSQWTGGGHDKGPAGRSTRAERLRPISGGRSKRPYPPERITISGLPMTK